MFYIKENPKVFMQGPLFLNTHQSLGHVITCKPGWFEKKTRNASALLRIRTEARSAGNVGFSKS